MAGIVFFDEVMGKRFPVVRVVMKENRLLSIVLGLGVLIALGFGVWFAMSSKKQPSESSNKVPIVFVKSVKKQVVFDEVSFPAQVVSDVHADVRSESEGLISKMWVSIGQRVRKGQRLMSVAHTDPVYSYRPVHVRAPVSGVVGRVDVSMGSRVKVGQELMLIIEPRRVHLEMEVTASDYAVFKKGMAGQFMPSQGTTPVSVTLRGISPFVDPVTGTATSELRFVDGRTKHLVPGIVGRVTFRTHVREGVLVPIPALVYRGNKVFVTGVEDGKAKRHEVTVGKTHKDLVEIGDGLSDGMQIVVRASRFVADGDPVKIHQEKSQSQESVEEPETQEKPPKDRS